MKGLTISEPASKGASKADLKKQMYEKAAPLMKILQNYSDTLFKQADLTHIPSFIHNPLKTYMESSLPNLIFDNIGELALPFIVLKEKTKLLDKDILERCDKWSAEIIEKAKTEADFKQISHMIASRVVGPEETEKKKAILNKLETQLESLLNHQDNPLLWELATLYVRATLVQVMADIQTSTHSSPLKFGPEILKETVKTAFKEPLNDYDTIAIEEAYNLQHGQLTDIEQDLTAKEQQLTKLKQADSN